MVLGVHHTGPEQLAELGRALVLAQWQRAMQHDMFTQQFGRYGGHATISAPTMQTSRRKRKRDKGGDAKATRWGAMSEEEEKYVYVYNDSDNDDLVAKIGGSEFAFIPVAVDKTFKAYYSGGNTNLQPMVEYAVFGLDNSDNTLG